MNFIRLVRKKNIFLESEKLFFLQSRAAQVSWEQRGEKTIEPEKLFFLQSHACMNFYKVSAQKKIAAWKIDFLQSHSFLQIIGENNVSGPQAYPHIDFGWIGSSPSMREKSNFSELEKLFSAKPPFSSSYWGKQCFRSPSLPTYWFWADWKQSKHARKKQFFGAWKIVFLQSLRFLQAIEENNVSGPQAYPHMYFGWIGSSASMREKQKSELEQLLSAKSNYIP